MLLLLILLIRSHCKIFPLPTIQYRMFVLFTIDKHARLYCSQQANFAMGPNEQNQCFVELRQKVCLCKHALVLLRGLTSLDGKLTCFDTKKNGKSGQPSLSQTDYSDVTLRLDSARLGVSRTLLMVPMVIGLWRPLHVLFI